MSIRSFKMFQSNFALYLKNMFANNDLSVKKIAILI